MALINIVLTFLTFLFSLASANPDRTTRTRSTPTPTPTRCVPTATATAPGTIEYPTWPSQGAGGGNSLSWSNNWVFIACSVYTSSSCSGEVTGCDPSCCNKGSCGESSTTNLLLSPSPSSPYYIISALAPSTSFTIFDVTFTTGYFLPQYPSVTIEITGTRADGTILAPQSFIINKPSGTFYTSVPKNLVQMGLGNVKELRFLAYYTGTWGAGGQGPDGRVLAESRLDGNGSGGPIRYEAYTPLCRRGGYRRNLRVEKRDLEKRGIVIGSKGGDYDWNE